jgi:hypothetical protein
MPTAFARLDARGNGVCSAVDVLALPRRRCAGRYDGCQPWPRLPHEQKPVRRDTQRRFSCFVAWPSVY